MPLTDTAIRNAKPADKPIKKFDERGLFLLVTPAGGKWWRLRYKFDGPEKLLSLGVYPDVGLKDARGRRDEARKLLADGIDPGQSRKAMKSARMDRAANSFEVVTREWFTKYSATWAANHGDRIIRRFVRDIFPWIGGRPIAEINAPELLTVVRKIESRGALETAHRALGNCGQVLRYAIATGRAERDLSSDLRGALPPVKGEHFSAITDPAKVGQLLRALDCIILCRSGRCAVRLYARPFGSRTAWANWCSIKSGRNPSTSSSIVRAIARKPCPLISSLPMPKRRIAAKIALSLIGRVALRAPGKTYRLLPLTS